MMDAILEIKRLVTSSSEATRHVSTINFQDLGALESSLHISFVSVRAEECDEATTSMIITDDETEKWDANRHEAKHKDAYLEKLQSKIISPVRNLVIILHKWPDFILNPETGAGAFASQMEHEDRFLEDAEDRPA